MSGPDPSPWTKTGADQATAEGDTRFAWGAAGPGVQADTNEYIPRQGTTIPGATYYQPQAPQYPPQASYWHSPPIPFYQPVYQPAYQATANLPYADGQYYCLEQPPVAAPYAYYQAQGPSTNYAPHFHYYPTQQGMADTHVYPTYGATRAEVQAANIQIAEQTGANKPAELVPFKPSPGQQYWCRELDGSWSLRSVNECMGELQPGTWQKNTNGAVYFVRHQ